MSKPRRPAVPSIPPLTGIQDEQTRLVLKAIIDQLSVRNGYVGDGTDKFLTVQDLKDAATGKSIQSGSAPGTVIGGVAPGGGGGGGGLVGAIIDSLVSAIQNSWLWKKLEERITWIETDAMASIHQQLTTASDTAGAAASHVTQLQTQVDGTKVIAQQALQVTQNINGTLSSSWTVKMQAVGSYYYATGFGLAMNCSGSTCSSKFYIMADEFAVGSPTFNGGTPVVPFVIKTTDWTENVNGTTVTHGPGVYMTNVKIANATIDNLVVTTTLIAPNALGAPVLYEAADRDVVGAPPNTHGDWVTVLDRTISGLYGGGVMATVSFTMDSTAAAHVDAFGELALVLYSGGTRQGIAAQKFGVRSNSGGDVYAMLPVSAVVAKDFAATSSPFNATIQVHVRSIPNPSGNTKPFVVRNVKLVVHGVRR